MDQPDKAQLFAPLSQGAEIANGDYELVRLLGKGAFGEVWLARNTSLRREVALKFFVGGGSRAELDRLVAEEGPKLAALSGKQSDGWENVLIVHRCVVSSGQTPPFLELEYMDGGSMRSLLGKTGINDDDLILRIALQIGRGLVCSHRHGIVHCDLKPDNILCDGGQRIFKLSDFGLAVKLALGERRGGGTLPYMSPEQFGDADKLSPASDIYAMGCVMYECLEGHPPFRVDKEVPNDRKWSEYRSLHRDEQPERPKTSACSDELKDLVMRCLSKTPEARPQASEFVQSIHSIGRGGLRLYQQKPRVDKLVLVEDLSDGADLIENRELAGLQFKRIAGPGSAFFPQRAVTQSDFLHFFRDPPYTKWNPQSIRLDAHDGGYLADWFQGHPRRGYESAVLASVPFQAAEEFCRWIGGELPDYSTLEQFFDTAGDPRSGRCHPVVRTLWEYMQQLRMPFLQLWCRDERTKGSRERTQYRFGFYPGPDPALDELQRQLRKVQRPHTYCFRSYVFVPMIPDEYTTGIVRRGAAGTTPPFTPDRGPAGGDASMDSTRTKLADEADIGPTQRQA